MSEWDEHNKALEARLANAQSEASWCYAYLRFRECYAAGYLFNCVPLAGKNEFLFMMSKQMTVAECESVQAWMECYLGPAMRFAKEREAKEAAKRVADQGGDVAGEQSKDVRSVGDVESLNTTEDRSSREADLTTTPAPESTERPTSEIGDPRGQEIHGARQEQEARQKPASGATP